MRSFTNLTPGEITHKKIANVLLIGFSLVIVLLLTSGIFGVGNIRSIQTNAANLIREQEVTNRLIGELQREQSTLSAVFYNLAQAPDKINYSQLALQLDKIDEDMDRIADEANSRGSGPSWSQLNQASVAFTEEARRLLTTPDAPTLASRDLFHLHEQVISIISRLIGSSYQKVVNAQSEIDRRSGRLMKESAALLGGSLLFALIGTALTIRLTAQLFRRMEWQAGELSRVSWNMLRDQETIARRFSHELHDELGQSLTAVKANLMALEPSPDHGSGSNSRARLKDCVNLVNEAISNVRELSQLLRPTILDDFGLDAGLRWLCEGFTQRTGIEVQFTSNLTTRLPDETETHLFRIAQEALTNVARHSGAAKVRVELNSEHNAICLAISDNGKGIAGIPSDGKSLGMTGMRARARAAGGSLRLKHPREGGLRIEVEVPVHKEQNDPHFVG